MRFIRVFVFLIITIPIYSQDWLKELIVTDEDKFKNQTINYLFGNMTSDKQIEFNLWQVKDTAGINNYIWLNMRLGKWYDIKRNEPSLVLLVDGEKLEYTASEVKADYDKNKHFRDKAYYPVSVDDLNKFAFAKDIQMAIYTEKGRLETSFIEQSFKLVKMFWEKFIFNQ